MVFQSKAQILGRAGERWFQSILPREWIFQKPEEDIGIDGKITIGTSEKTGSLEFAIQIKSSKTWEIRNGKIIVEGIKTDTISYWGSRLYPTLLVLYDDEKSIGYYAWVFNIINHPLEFVFPHGKEHQKTIRLNVIPDGILTKDTFGIINSDVEQYYFKFTSEFKELKKTINVLPTINSLSKSVRGLYISLSHKPKGQNQRMYLDLLMAVSHREVILAMDKLQKQFQLEINTKNFVQDFITSYTNEVDQIMPDFGKTVFIDENVALAWSPEKHKKITPGLIDMLLELIVILTDKESKKEVSSFS